MLHQDTTTHGTSAYDGAAGPATIAPSIGDAGSAADPAPQQRSRSAAAPRYAEDQTGTPYADAIARFGDSDPLSLMVPGHGNAPGAGGEHIAELFGARVAQRDVPLLLEGIDAGENSPLVQSQRLAADAWGARRTWFLTNGASQANRTAAIAVRGLGERILIQRAMHSSLTDGVLLAGLAPAFVAPSVDTRHGIAHGLTPEALEAALVREERAGRAVSSVYVVSPSYFGSVADVAGLVEVAHRHDAAIIVDNAWGAHFGFHPDLPESPARLGADLVVSSTHKLAGSLTQSAMLHLGHGPFAERLEPLVARAYSMTSSTSMSAVLMGSLDTARHAMATGEERIGRAVRAAREIRDRLDRDPRFSDIGDGFGAFPDITSTDPLRVPIDVSRLGRSGHWVRSALKERHGVYLEMSTATSIVAVIGATREVDVDRFMAALDEVAREAERLGSEPMHEFPELPEPGVLRILPRDAYFGASEVVPAEQAIGRISADTLAAYPPGIPNMLPGEEITVETVDFLRAVAASPTGYVRGSVDPEVSLIRVVAE
ncbi:aminotransferase class I/II-fold pyridoxal phosphate-dependent enzyme [Leucobacter tenebrionis]|uniref:aminotransferase class I/II-fold pyridoxal phosphate-dependent enzyme n=1 Tax=Leucobacter tenebrionis TaxID=2873270 RepID=UPI001CA77463|nr:aminotransferase class I/II-fold pyridoxal phosphate-dependent enzyme [Leucobacter tenebrionis]QZY52491.1 aminotransferase class I/II-fold pyridoxal phosphate-dependent enzyme [Leucobacter tenebrionis]